MRRKILILNDRFPIRDTLINLGDRAMVSGLYRAVEEHLGYEIVSGGCKNFPYYNIRRYKMEREKNDVAGVFRKWFEETTEVAPHIVMRQKRIADFLDRSILFRNRMFQRLEDRVKTRFSRGLVETAKPFLLRKYVAHQFLEKTKSVDCVLFNGAAIVADRFSFYLPAHLFECYLAKRLGKNVFTANQTIDIEDPLVAEMVSHVYGSLDCHLTREPLTRDVLLRLGVEEEKIISSCDAAFAAEYPETDQASRLVEEEGLQKGAVGLVIRGDLDVDFETWALIIDHLVSVRKKQVFFAFTCIAHDEDVYKELAKRCNVRRLSRFYDYKELARLMERFDFLLSDRYHALVFAIHAKTPVVPINPEIKTIKTEGLFRLFDYPVKVIPRVNKGTYGQVLEAIRYVEEHRSELKEILAGANRKIKRKFEEDIGELAMRVNRPAPPANAENSGGSA
jgi:polysaccharide pyruvyl transferase WcaK-like protein